jgi:hypothetical protein
MTLARGIMQTTILLGISVLLAGSAGAKARAKASPKARANSPAPLAQAGTPLPSAPEQNAPLAAPLTEEQAIAAATFEASEYKMVGENIHYSDPSFVTYKMRPEVVQRRVNTDVALIP